MSADEIVILANSLKWGGRCIAGISTRTGRWVRPVSGRPHGELPPFLHRIDGRDLALLDVVGIQHEGSVGDPTQPENVRVTGARWRRVGRVSEEEAASFLGPHLVDGPRLLGNRGGAVPESKAKRGVDASLAIAAPSELEFRLDSPREGTGRHRPRVSFELAGEGYDLSLTDTVIRPRLLRAGPGTHGVEALGLDPAGRILLTVSLAEAREDWCTKLVAAVLALPGD